MIDHSIIKHNNLSPLIIIISDEVIDSPQEVRHNRKVKGQAVGGVRPEDNRPGVEVPQEPF